MSESTTKLTTGLYINGRRRATEDVFEVHDPARPDTVVGHAAAATVQDVADAVAAAKAAHPEWSAAGAVQRAEQMGRAVEGLEAFRDDDAAILSQENGKIVQEAWIDALVFQLRWGLSLSLTDEVERPTVLSPAPGSPVETTISHQSLGVVSIIVPFNWPLAILAAALPYALLAGNTVVVKAPPTTPLAVVRVVERVAEKLPAGVLNVITGRDENMSGLIRNTDVAKVSFTGSVGGGKKMMEMASGSLTRVTLELGGNDAAVILADAPLDEMHLDRLYHSVFDSAGQICMNAKRLLVHRSRLPEVVDGLTRRLSGVVLGHGLDPATTMGPLNSAAQRDFVNTLVDEAKAAGADVREFGELPEGELAGGNFVRPAIVITDDHDLRIVTEEQFGPVIPVSAFESEDEAVELANDTWAGLGASVWTEDTDVARRVGSKLAVGYVWINDHGADRLDLRAPFGGMKSSGMGREQGIEGVRDFQDTHSLAFLDEAAVGRQ